VWMKPFGEYAALNLNDFRDARETLTASLRRRAFSFWWLDLRQEGVVLSLVVLIIRIVPFRVFGEPALFDASFWSKISLTLHRQVAPKTPRTVEKKDAM